MLVEYEFLVPWKLQKQMLVGTGCDSIRYDSISHYLSVKFSVEIRYAGTTADYLILKFTGTEDELVTFLLKTDFEKWNP